MTNGQVLVGFGAGLAMVAWVTAGCGRASAQSGGVDSKTDRVVELTVYKEDFAMVSEKRVVALRSGHSRMAIQDISKQLDPNSVLFDWPNQEQHPEVVATTYNLGLGDGSTVLSRLNGQTVEMMWPSTDGKAGDVITGRLEAAEQGGNFALRTKDKLYVNPNGTIIASADSASTLPLLSVEFDSAQASKTSLAMSYLTRGMSWSADYVAKLDPVADIATVECWASVKNSTGIPFPEAKVTLMAGSPNRAVAKQPTAGESSERSMDKAAAAPARLTPPRAQSEEVGEMVAYKIPSVATIGQDQVNRVSLFGSRPVPVRRDYAIRVPSLNAWGYEGNGERGLPHVSATLSISFVNNEAANLGMPLPSGSVAVYQKDEQGQARYTGAATIGDTAKQEHVNLTLTNVFDVYAAYKVLSSREIDKHTVRKTVEVTVHNEKRAPILVRLVQCFEDQWKPVQESEPGVKLDGSTKQWTLLVNADLTKTVTYTVDLKNELGLLVKFGEKAHSLGVALVANKDAFVAGDDRDVGKTEDADT